MAVMLTSESSDWQAEGGYCGAILTAAQSAGFGQGTTHMGFYGGSCSKCFPSQCHLTVPPSRLRIAGLLTGSLVCPALTKSLHSLSPVQQCSTGPWVDSLTIKTQQLGSNFRCISFPQPCALAKIRLLCPSSTPALCFALI